MVKLSRTDAMESPRRGRPPSTAKPGRFALAQTSQKRSSSRSSVFRRLSQSTTSLVASNGNGPSRDGAASPTPAEDGESTGRLSFRRHLQKATTKFLGLGEDGAVVPPVDGGPGSEATTDHEAPQDPAGDGIPRQPPASSSSATSPPLSPAPDASAGDAAAPAPETTGDRGFMGFKKLRRTDSRRARPATAMSSNTTPSSPTKKDGSGTNSPADQPRETTACALPLPDMPASDTPRQQPCGSCSAFYNVAWAQSKANMYALSAQLAAAHQQVGGQVALLHERDARIAELEALVERLRLRIQEQVTQLDGGGPTLASSGVGSLPDGQIRTRWKGLRWLIRQTVEAQLANTSSSLSEDLVVPSDRALFLRRLTPDYLRFLHARAGAVHLAEAAVWTVLADGVFSGERTASRMCWAAHWSQALAKINDNLLYSRSTDAAFHQWRAQTAAFVRGLDAADEQAALVAPYADTVVRQLEAELGVVLAAQRSSKLPPAAHDSSSNSDLRRQLRQVVHEAIALDADLCQQRAWFYVRYPTAATGHRYGMPFAAAEMEALDNHVTTITTSSGSDPDEVALVVCPALFKAGNSRGEAYDTAEPVEPSIVCRAASTRHLIRRR